MYRILYFAYGSNLDSGQMKLRCPDSEEVSTAVLEGWQLRERTFADIEPAPGACVHGALYRISRNDLFSLDLYEGYPDFYTRERVTVKDKDGVCRQAMVYFMTPPYQKGRCDGPYPERYRQICSAGADHWGVPNAFARPAAS